MIREVLAREAPSLLILLSARAKLRGFSIDAMADEEIIAFVEREFGRHVAEFLRRIASRYN